ncbi:hypothetical protein AWH48_03820 [Domibacillus aminovorans]|uniref:Uncharacterized protein n=1 Tax=Domibacillus aminovorans TaxID=29332 RepID=A0A177KR21_9BACI|nr:hypothetical protein [Domibacillus aminovorans]OAH55813.1 hypothetical protein AWH48_03820 [Domibacillus aminovorans]
MSFSFKGSVKVFKNKGLKKWTSARTGAVVWTLIMSNDLVDANLKKTAASVQKMIEPEFLRFFF